VRAHRITIRHLLSHTSGLRDAFILQGLRPDHPDNINGQIVSILAHARGLNFAPGSQFEYNNGAYRLLAAIVERVSGQKFSVSVDANIFKPLGMAHSYMHDDAAQVIPNRATGKLSRLVSHPSRVLSEPSSGSPRPALHPALLRAHFVQPSRWRRVY